MNQQYSDLEILEVIEDDEMKKIIGGRHGADDGPNHDVGDDHGGRRGGRGRRGRGRDDGPNHT